MEKKRKFNIRYDKQSAFKNTCPLELTESGLKEQETRFVSRSLSNQMPASLLKLMVLFTQK